MAFYPGQLVGNYEIVELIGQGGMATVYKAHHTKLNRNVALKAMYESYVSNPQSIVAFQSEAQTIGRLDHPNIVPVYDYAESDGVYYLVMKFIEGISLTQALDDGLLDIGDVRNVMESIAKALDYAHSQGVLHRDVKPSNIMIDLKGVIYLADFGLARTASLGESAINQQSMVGTPAYMSPEQTMGQSMLDSRSDIYSLGIVLYQMLAGRPPFRGSTPLALAQMHQTQQAPLPSQFNPEITKPVERVVMQAISKDREKRFDSAGELFQAFDEAVKVSEMDLINPFERHTIAFSLAKPRPKGTAIPRDSKIVVGKELAAVARQAQASNKAQAKGSKLDIILLIGLFAAISILIIAVVIWQISSTSNTGIPTAVPTQIILPDATGEPTAESVG